MEKRKGFFVTGTDTGVGKTLVSLGLCLHFKASYWKPIQTGKPRDIDFIKKFLPRDQIHPSAYELKEPLSPNQAGKKEGISIDLEKIVLPHSSFLIVEGLGGVHVPLNEDNNLMDLMKQIDFPLILVARSGLGTLNHSFLTIEVLKRRNLKLSGLILSGPRQSENKRDIESKSGLPVLLEIPPLPCVKKEELIKLFSNLKGQEI